MVAPLSPGQRRKQIIERLLAADNASKSLLDYTAFTMPDYRDPDNVKRSRYARARVHAVIADALEKLEQRKILRLIINCAPRHGKSELASKRFMAWYSGRHPDESLIFGTYNDTFAEDVGRAVRDNIQSQQHQQAFPHHRLKDGSAAAKRLETEQGGILAFVGRGGSITGRGGHGIIIDDPIKDRQEADSKLIRDQLWTWFSQVIATRLMTPDSFIMLIQTRWHEDDLVGRLTDPRNPFYDPAEAARWTVIDLPALAGDNDPMGRKPGEALWPERFPVSFLEQQRQLDPRGFQALYQGKPSADTGTFFTSEMIRTYQPDELPKHLRYYIASDHAVSSKQDRDKTCLIPVGVDENESVYVLDDVWWRRAETDVVVEAMLTLMQRHRPIYWWAERGHISRSIGPFLRKRMLEESTYVSLIEVQPIADKQTRAQSIQGRMAMGKVFFPARAVWWPDARDQLMKFPNGANDDFVDALAYIGLGLTQQLGAFTPRSQTTNRPGTFGWLKEQTRIADREARLKRDTADW